MNRRQFVQSMGAILPGFLFYRWNMHLDFPLIKETQKLRATNYYVQPLHIDPNGANFTVEMVTGYLKTKVDREDLRKAKIEASARLDLTGLQTGCGSIGVGYDQSKGWFINPNAPYGIGSKDNPLVPGYTFASNFYPFGTMLVMPMSTIKHYLPRVLFCGDVFGGQQKDDRIDIFTEKPIQGWGIETLTCRIVKPMRDFSSNPIKGAQECLNLLGITGENGQSLTVDGDFQTQTKYALNTFILTFKSVLEYIPTYIHPADPSLYFWLRLAGKQAKENGN